MCFSKDGWTLACSIFFFFGIFMHVDFAEVQKNDNKENENCPINNITFWAHAWSIIIYNLFI